MAEDKDQSILSNTRHRTRHHREYKQRSIDRKLGLVYYDDSSDGEDTNNKQKLVLYSSWKTESQSDTDPDYSPSEEDTTHPVGKYSHSTSYFADDEQESFQPSVPKVVLKRSYSSGGDGTRSTQCGVKKHRVGSVKGREYEDLCLNNLSSYVYEACKTDSTQFKRGRGRPRKNPLVTKNPDQIDNNSSLRSKYSTGSDFSLEDICNLYEVNKAKQSLKKQVESKRTLSTDSTGTYDYTKIDRCAKEAKDKTVHSRQSIRKAIQRSIHDDEIDYKPKNSRYCSSKSDSSFDDSTSHRSINIDRCLRWTFRLSEFAWSNHSNNLKLLKRKYPVLNVLFKKDPVINLKRLNVTNVKEIQRNCVHMESSFMTSDINSVTKYLVDPKVVSLSKTLLFNVKKKSAADNISNKSKFKQIKHSKPEAWHRTPKSKHNLNFKLKLKEACKPKSKLTDKKRLQYTMEQEHVKLGGVHKGALTCNENVCKEKSKDSDLENRKTVETKATFDIKDKEYGLLEYESKQLQTDVVVSSPGSPGPPHLEKEYMRDADEGSSDTEMEILQMNDFEIEICIDKNDGLHEVLDMRTGVKHSKGISETVQTSAAEVRSEIGANKINDNISRDKLDLENVENISLKANSIELVDEKDTATDTDRSSCQSPSPIIIKDVCSLNESYNVHNDPSVFNQRILKMLDGDIFESPVADAKPLDLAKPLKISEDQYAYESDETFIYSDLNNSSPELCDEACYSKELSPRIKALQKTKPEPANLKRMPVLIKPCLEASVDSRIQEKNNSHVCEKGALVSISSPNINENQPVQQEDEHDESDSHLVTEEHIQNSRRTFSEATHQYNNQQSIDVNDLSESSETFAIESVEGVPRSNCKSTDKNTEPNTEKVTGGNLIINETQTELNGSEPGTVEKQCKLKHSKSLSFVKSLDKSKEIKDFMAKEKERRKSLGLKDNKRPKLMNKGKTCQIEDPEDLPQILPPKRRHRVQKVNSTEESNGDTKSVSMERIMADFPKHNWLFNKYNNKNSTETMENVSNKETSSSESVRTTGSESIQAPVSESVTMATSPLPSSTTPIVAQHTGIPALVSRQSYSKHHAHRINIMHGPVNETANATLAHTASTTSVEECENHLERLPENSIQVPVTTIEESNEPGSSTCAGFMSTQRKEHDPTLASLNVDASPDLISPLEGLYIEDKETVSGSSLSQNNPSVSSCEPCDIMVKDHNSGVVQSNDTIAQDTNVGSPKTYKNNSWTYPALQSLAKSDQNSDNNFVSDNHYPVQNNTTIGRSHNITSEELKLGTYAESDMELSSLKPETIQAIKLCNPTLVQLEFSQKDSLVTFDSDNKNTVKDNDGNATIPDVKSKEDAIVACASRNEHVSGEVCQIPLTSGIYCLDEKHSKVVSMDQKSSLDDTYPLNMTKNQQAEKVIDRKTWSNTGIATKELGSVEAPIGRDESVPLDLCMNRSVAESCLVSHRKQHPPPVQMVHPQVQKPLSNEMAADDMETDTVAERAVVQDAKADADKDDQINDTAELPSPLQNRLNITHTSQSRNDGSIHDMSEIVTVPNKVNERKRTGLNATVVSESVLDRNQAVTVSSSAEHVPIGSGFDRTVPFVTQYQPVLVRPVQQINSIPRLTVSAQVVQPIMSFQTNTETSFSPSTQTIENAHFSPNNFTQSSIQVTSPSVHQVQPNRHVNDINAANQQTQLGNYSVFIPAGQIYVPFQPQTNPQQVTSHIANNTLGATNATHVRNYRNTTRRLLPKPNEVPSKKQKVAEDDSCQANDSLYTSEQLQTVIDPPVTVVSPCSVDETANSDGNKVINENTESPGVLSRLDSKDTSSDNTEPDKRGESSDELLEEDEDLKFQMEEYRKLKEERKRKEKEEMELKRKIVEKMKLSKSRKQLECIKKENSSHLPPDNMTNCQTINVTAIVSNSSELDNKVEIISHDSMAKDLSTSKDENETIEVVAEWNVPTSDTSEMHKNDSFTDYNNSSSFANEYVDTSVSSKTSEVAEGLDLRVEQKSVIMSSDKSTTRELNENILNTGLETMNRAENRDIIVGNQVQRSFPIECSVDAYVPTSIKTTFEKADFNVKTDSENSPSMDSSKSDTCIMLSSNISSFISTATMFSHSNNANLIDHGKSTSVNEIEQCPYSPPILTPRSITVQPTRTMDFEDLNDIETSPSTIKKDDIVIETEIKEDGNESSLNSDIQNEIFKTSEIEDTISDPSSKNILDYSLSSVADTPKQTSEINLSVTPKSDTKFESTSIINRAINSTDSISTTASFVVSSEMAMQSNDRVCTVTSSFDVPIMSSGVTEIACSNINDDKTLNSKTDSDTPYSSNLSKLVFPDKALTPESKAVVNISMPEVIDLTTKCSDLMTEVIDYSTKPLLPTCSIHGSTQSLLDDKAQDLQTKCTSVLPSTSFVCTSPASVLSEFQGHSKRLDQQQKCLPSDQAKGGVFYQIPLAHTKSKTEKHRKGAKPLPAHNNNQVVSLKPLIKKMNKTHCLVPIQIQQSCPHFRKTLQYNWSPSPKDTLRAKLSRRETPVPPTAHNQKPFSIAGKLIIPAGRFNRKRTRSTEHNNLTYGIAKTPYMAADLSQSTQQSPSILQTPNQKPDNLSPVHAFLPPIRAHIHLDGNADTVTVTNVQKPSSFLEYPKCPVSIMNCEKQPIVDLTCDEGSNGQDKAYNRNLPYDDAEKQAQQELSKALYKRQKIDNSNNEPMAVTNDFSVISNRAGEEQNTISQNMEVSNEVISKRSRQQLACFQVNNPVLPTGVVYQPLSHASPNRMPHFTPERQDDCHEPTSDKSKTVLIRHMLQTQQEDVQAQPRVLDQRQSHLESRVPPLLRLRDFRTTQQSAYVNQQETQTRRLSSQMVSDVRFQQGGFMRPPHGFIRAPPVIQQAQTRYSLPSGPRLSSPPSPSQRVPGPQLQRFTHQQPYNGPSHLVAASSPRQRYHPFPQRNPNIKAYGQGPVGEMNYIPEYEQNSLNQNQRGAQSSPEYPGYDTLGHRSQALLQSQAPRSNTLNVRQLLANARANPKKGQLPSPNTQMRYSGNPMSRDYINSPSQGQQTMGPMPYAPTVPDQEQHMQMQRLRPSLSTNQQPIERFMANNRGQPYMPSRQQMPPPAHSSVESSSLQWPSSSGYSPQTFRAPAVQERLPQQAIEKFIPNNRGQPYMPSRQQMPPPAHSSVESGSLQWPSSSGYSPQTYRASAVEDRLPQERSDAMPPTNVYMPAPARIPTIQQYEKPHTTSSSRNIATYSSMTPQTPMNNSLGTLPTVTLHTSKTEALPDQRKVYFLKTSPTEANQVPVGSQVLQNRNPNESFQDNHFQPVNQTLPSSTLFSPKNQGVSNIIQPLQNDQMMQISEMNQSRSQTTTYANINPHGNKQVPGNNQYNNQYKETIPGGPPFVMSQNFQTQGPVVVTSNPTQRFQQSNDDLPVVQVYTNNNFSNAYQSDAKRNLVHIQDQASHSVPNRQQPTNQSQPITMNTPNDNDNRQWIQRPKQQATVTHAYRDIQKVQSNIDDNIKQAASNQNQVQILPGKQMNQVNPIFEGQEQNQQLPGNQGQHSQPIEVDSINRKVEGENECIEIVDVAEDSIPHLQQVHGSCVLCGKFSLYLCSTCKRVWYCSPACQMSHWQSHSSECNVAT